MSNEYLIALRKGLNLTQTEVAARTGLSCTTILKLESDERLSRSRGHWTRSALVLSGFYRKSPEEIWSDDVELIDEHEGVDVNTHLVRLRQQLNLTLFALAELIGVSNQSISRFERRQQPYAPHGGWLRNALALADFHRIPPEDIWPPNEYPRPLTADDKLELSLPPLPRCEFCGEEPGGRPVRVDGVIGRVCIICARRIERFDRDAPEPRSHPGHRNNLVREWPPETRMRFHAIGVDALNVMRGLTQEDL